MHRGSGRNSPLGLQDLLLGSEHDSGPQQVLTAYLDYMEELGMLLGGQPTSTREQMRQVLDSMMLVDPDFRINTGS